jgi:hypothetical protein
MRSCGVEHQKPPMPRSQTKLLGQDLDTLRVIRTAVVILDLGLAQTPGRAPIHFHDIGHQVEFATICHFSSDVCYRVDLEIQDA